MSSPNDPKAAPEQAPQGGQYPWASPSGLSAPGPEASAPRPSYGLPGPAPEGFPSPEAAAAQRELPEADQFMPLRPLGLGDILAAGVSFSRVKPKIVFGTSLLFYGVAFLVSSIIVSLTSPRYLASSFSMAFSDRAPEAQTPEGFTEYLVGVFSSSLLTFIIAYLLICSLAPLMHAAVTGRELSFADALASLRKNWLRTLLGLLLYFLFSGVVVAVIAGAGAGVGFLLQGSPVGVFATVALSFLLLGIALLFVTLRLMFIPYAVVLEGAGALAACRRSWQLTSGRAFWRIGGIAILATVIWSFLQQVVALLPAILVGIVTAFAMALYPDHGHVIAIVMMVTSLLVSFLVTALTHPLLVATYTALFYDTKMRREGYDMQLQQELRESRE